MDIYREKPVRISVKVLVPIREHPKVSMLHLFNIAIFLTVIYICSCYLKSQLCNLSCFSLILLGNCWVRKVIQ